MCAQQRPPRPWPIKWIVVAILVVIIPYTYLRWHYRKPGRAFEPHHDIRERANTLRLLSAGFQRINLEADRPVEPLRRTTVATVSPAPGGLPEALAATLVEKPQLPSDVVSVSASGSTSSMFSYPIELTCTVADHHQQLSGAQLYVRADALVIVPQFEKLRGELLARSRETFARLTVPAGALKPGQYHVTLVGARSSRSWSLEVR